MLVLVAWPLMPTREELDAKNGLFYIDYEPEATYSV